MGFYPPLGHPGDGNCFQGLFTHGWNDVTDPFEIYVWPQESSQPMNSARIQLSLKLKPCRRNLAKP